MPNFSFESKVRSVDLIITINDISEETANRIREYIQAETKVAIHPPKVVVLDDNPAPEKTAETTSDAVQSAKTFSEAVQSAKTFYEKRIAAYKGYREITSIIDEAQKTANRKWKWMTAKEFVTSTASLTGCSSKSAGQVLSGLALLGKIEIRREPGHPTKYYLPAPETKTEKFGKKLRDLREAHDLSVDEVADRIGYSKTLVQAWENGTLPLKTEFDAYQQLVKLYGRSEWDKHFAM